MNDKIAQGEYLKKGLGRPLYRSIKLAHDALGAAGQWEAASNLSYFLNVPYRALGRMSGRLDDGQMEAVMKLINGEDGGKDSFVEATKARYRKK